MTEDLFPQAQHRARGYIARLQTDPRIRMMAQAWAHQATMEAEDRYPDPRDSREAMHMAAERAITLAMSFVLDNDGELQAVLAERDSLLKHMIEFGKFSPIAMPDLVAGKPAR